MSRVAFILGVDVGLTGAVTLLTADGGLVEVVDMPTLRDGPKNRPSINAPLLAELVYRCHATEAFIEHVSARPGEGAVGAFAFGRCRGVIEGVLAACGVPTRFITPAFWKRTVGLALASKDASRSEATRRWPGQAALFARVKDDGRAEAALIAIARKRQRQGIMIARDAAVTVSIALQFGADIETIRAALTKDHDGGPATAIAAALDALSGDSR